MIVETSPEDFPLEASAGSHFFHNVTSMNVAYLSVNHRSANCLIKWDTLNNQSLKEKTKFVKHIEFKKPLKIQIDGKKGLQCLKKGNNLIPFRNLD